MRIIVQNFLVKCSASSEKLQLLSGDVFSRTLYLARHWTTKRTEDGREAATDKGKQCLSCSIGCGAIKTASARAAFVKSKTQQAVWSPGSADTVCPRPSVTLTFDRLTLKLMWKSVGNLRSKFGHAMPLVLELFAMYAPDGQTDRHADRQTDGQKQRLLPPYLLSEA